MFFLCIFLEKGSKTEILGDSTSNIKVLPDGTLSFAKVDAAMEGSYTCEASNDFGPPLSKTIFISVRGIYW